MSIRRKLALEAEKYGEIREKAKEELTKILSSQVGLLSELDGTTAKRKMVKEAILQELGRRLREWVKELLET